MTRRAAIAVFVYERAGHTRRLLESLRRNPEASASPIRIFCDGPRAPRDRERVAAARKVVAELAPEHAQVIERDANLGLANSVIQGVSAVAAEFGEAIVLEDDLELSPVALDYFNRALERYRAEPRVMHVSGYMYPVGVALPETFFYREATCWGWATWQRAWARLETDGRKIRDAVLARAQRREFNAGDSLDFFGMLEAAIRGQVDSWAIRWYGSLWLHGGLALHPGQSLVRNTGHDGSGRHSGVTRQFEVDLRAAPVRNFADAITESQEALRAVIAYRRRRLPVLGRLWRGLKESLA